MTRAIPHKLTLLAVNFISQYPVLPQRPHTELTSDDLDAFGLGQGVYGALTASSSSAELNEARGTLVSRLNKAGSSESWTAATDGFQIDVVQRNGMTPTRWQVKPLPVSASHRAAGMMNRNVKTITNRVLKHERIYDRVDRNQLTDPEKRAIDEEREIVVRLAQSAADIARIENAIMNKTLNRLAKKDPNNRLLPK